MKFSENIIAPDIDIIDESILKIYVKDQQDEYLNLENLNLTWTVNKITEDEITFTIVFEDPHIISKSVSSSKMTIHRMMI